MVIADAEEHGRFVGAGELVFSPDARHFAKLFDIHMLCASTGQERTEQEYTTLLEQAGWKHAKTWYPASGLLGVIEAMKG